jgi:succinate-acetate transporter protein
MTARENETIIKDRTANPAPIGLMGFGMTTILLNLHNAGYMPLGAAILAMGIFFGGLAQVMVGVMEWKKGNMFGSTVFTSFGFFWIILVTIILAPKLGIASTETPLAMGWFLGVWGIYCVFLTIGTLRTNRVMQFTFVSLCALFFMLAFADVWAIPDLKVLAGYVGILAGAGAVYMAMAQVLNETLGRTVVPVFPVNGKTTKPIEKGSSTD